MIKNSYAIEKNSPKNNLHVFKYLESRIDNHLSIFNNMFKTYKTYRIVKKFGKIWRIYWSGDNPEL